MKLSPVAPDIFGASGTRIIEELVKGDLTEDHMGELKQGQVMEKKET